MNKQEAIKWFEALLHYLADDECNEDARAAANLAIDALRVPQPDPITGLVPCGCGGALFSGESCEVCGYHPLDISQYYSKELLTGPWPEWVPPNRNRMRGIKSDG